jgi:hypothetical protein
MFFLNFLYKFCPKNFHSKKNLGRYNKKFSYVSMQSTRYSCQILMKLEFSRQIFYNFSNSKFHENPSSGAEFFHADRQKDRHDEVSSGFSQFSERA